MPLKRLLPLCALLTVLVTSIAVAAPASAQDENPSAAAAELCRELDEAGALDETGFTRGQCVNYFVAQWTGDLNSLIVGLCSLDFHQEQFGNMGQCVSFWHEVFRNR